MAKRRQKHTRLPNGFGSVRYLGGGRRNPYAVHPPVTAFKLDGSPIMTKPICYTDSWLKGVQILTAWHAGTYTPGMEIDNIETDGEKAVAQMLANFNRLSGKAPAPASPTFKDVYEGFYIEKFNGGRELSESTRKSTAQAFNRCAPLHDRPFAELRHKDLQSFINGLTVSRATVDPVIGLFHQLYKYAISYEIVDRDYSNAIQNPKADTQAHGTPFIDRDLKTLWENREDPIIGMIVIMVYSGFRISEYKTLEINLSDGFFKGGIKTKAGKGRIVPVHSGIADLVRKRLKQDPALIHDVPGFRYAFMRALERVKIPRHTPHDTRHTFSALCERYGVSENDRKRMLGHSFGSDITNGVYGHRTLEDLRGEIEKIRIIE